MLLLCVIIQWMILSRVCLAQQNLLNELPSCAVKCFSTALVSTACSSTDITCLCSDTSFINTVSACNTANCTVIETLEATNTTYAACGVPIRSQTDIMMKVTATFGPIALLMVLMRLLDRYISAEIKLGWDDLLIGVSGFLSIGMVVPVLMSGVFRFGTDIWGMTAYQITKSLHWLYFAYPFYMATETFCQLSILAFYVRFLSAKQKTLYFIKGLMGLVAAFGLANTVTMIFQNWPINYFWNGWTGEMAAISSIALNEYGFIRGGLQIALDLIILCVPLPILYKLQMSPKKKIQIMSMFCVGFAITAVSCARLHALVQFAKTSNATYDNTPLIYWSVIESDLYIVVACMPSIRAVAIRMWSKFYPSNPSSKYYNSSDANSNFNSMERSHKSKISQTFGGISKSVEVNVIRTTRSTDGASDIELVDHRYLESFKGRDCPKDPGQLC